VSAAPADSIDLADLGAGAPLIASGATSRDRSDIARAATSDDAGTPIAIEMLGQFEGRPR
jgi:hypothetical protein